MVQSLAALVENSAEVFRDMGENLLIAPRGFASLSIPRRAVRKPGLLEAEVRAMRCAGGANKKDVPAGTLQLMLDRTLSVEFTLDQLEPCAAEIRYWRVPIGKLADGSHLLGLAADGRTIDSSFAVINEERIARRIERAQTKSAELAGEARGSGDTTRIAAAASCEMRAEDARRKFIMGPEFVEWANGAHAVDVNKQPLKLNADVSPADIDYILRVLVILG